MSDNLSPEDWERKQALFAWRETLTREEAEGLVDLGLRIREERPTMSMLDALEAARRVYEEGKRAAAALTEVRRWLATITEEERDEWGRRCADAHLYMLDNLPDGQTVGPLDLAAIAQRIKAEMEAGK